MLSMFMGGKHERTGFALYTEAVTAARRPAFYAELGVPDTLDGRFDLIGLHVGLLIRALRKRAVPGPAVAQAVFDAMFSDMDIALREMGVSDMSVGKKVRAMWEAFHGRAVAYETALDSPDAGALEAAVEKNVFRGGAAPDGSVARLAAYARALDTRLSGMDLAALTDARSCFAGVGDA